MWGGWGEAGEFGVSAVVSVRVLCVFGESVAKSMLRFIVVVYRWRDNSVDSGRLSRATGCSFLKQTAVYLASPLPFAASIHPKATLSSASCSIAYLVRNECKRHAATSAGRQVFSVGATRLAHEIHPCAVMSKHFQKNPWICMTRIVGHHRVGNFVALRELSEKNRRSF